MIAEGVYYSQRKLARKEATMAAMTQNVRELFETAENMVLCTASADGTPNGAAIGMKTVIDEETVYISDQFFKKTLANLKENQKVAVAFWTGHDAFQIHGTARYVNEGDEFAVQKEMVDAKFASMGLPIKAKGGCFIHWTRCTRWLRAPRPASNWHKRLGHSDHIKTRRCVALSYNGQPDHN